jgi:hypothetical protein
MEERLRERRRMPGAILGLAALLASLTLLVAPGGARAQYGVINWPELLPPNPFTPGGTVPLGFDVCPDGDPTCPDAVVLEMYERWRPLNASCDHRAVFALTYLRTTEEFVRTFKGSPGFFSDLAWISHEDALFAQLYFNAYDARETGGAYPRAWKIAFDAAASPNVTGIGDLLLGMSAHINRDLPYTLGAVGLLHPDGSSRKPDHDAVNAFLDRIADPLQVELAYRYDPLFETTDAEPSPLDEIGALQAVRVMRENAWRNAERLVGASSEAQRQQVAASIEAQSELAGLAILAGTTLPGYGPARDAWCRAHLRPSFEVEVLDDRLKDVTRSRQLDLGISTDGPARLHVLAESRQGEAFKPIGAADVHFSEAGEHQYSLALTREGRRILAERRTAEVRVSLSAPRGMGASTSKTLD